MDAGSCWHQAQEVNAHEKDPQKCEDLQVQTIEKFFIEHPVDETEFRNADRLVEGVKRYNKHYKHRQLTVLKDSIGWPMVEIEATLPLGQIEVNQTVNIGRGESILIYTLYVQWNSIIDRVVSFDGENFVLDFKSTTRGGPTFFEQFPLSQQLIGYVWSADQLCEVPIAGAIVDETVWRRPTPTGKPFDFDWQRFYYSKDQRLEWQANTMQAVATFVSSLMSSTFPMTGMSSGCVFKYGKCPYYDVCIMPAQHRKEILMSSDFMDATPREANGE